jgi:ArsR family transcriptional regulator, arsenate/arsenite/antimonite-responsive transcriptional repressor
LTVINICGRSGPVREEGAGIKKAETAKISLVPEATAARPPDSTQAGPTLNTKAVITEIRCSSLVDTPLAETEAAELAVLLAALADPVRLRLLSLVATQVKVCSCDLAGPLGKSQPTVSHHTKVLARAGLLVGERRGRWVWWRVEASRLAAVRRALGAQ